MEKSTPHYKLSAVKAMVEDGRVRVTASAVAGAELLGFDRVGMISVVLALKSANFYKESRKYNLNN